ncbi:MAG: putative imidazole glycerol phosphate synthase subunit hisF2 [Chitinophagales bacterium]|nr:MAG: putative imidazole glycerol phosphate synthase subunit hisF2 [Chitinophagales bacterium]
MYRPRIIPVLLLKENSLIKTLKFKEHIYIGDPINAIRIFNESKVDEIIVLDIYATIQKRCFDKDFVRILNEETTMPFAVGGGICSIDQIRVLIQAGAEKVVIGSAAYYTPSLIRDAASTFGSSTIVVCIDYRMNFWKKPVVFVENGRKNTSILLWDYVKKIEDLGAGEIILQSIERDGTMQGYDMETIAKVWEQITIPLVVLGGAGSIHDLKTLYQQIKVNGLASGSIFVFNDRSKGVLINYPTDKQFIY